MKYLYLLILLSTLVFAQEKMSFSEHFRIHNANNRPALKMKKKRNMRKLCKTDEQKAKEIASKICHNEKIKSLFLTHCGLMLYYVVFTESCKIKINVFNAKVLSKEYR